MSREHLLGLSCALREARGAAAVCRMDLLAHGHKLWQSAQWHPAQELHAVSWVRWHCCFPEKLKHLRVILKWFKTAAQSRYKDPATALTGKEARQHLLENNSSLETSAKEQILHSIEHPTTLNGNGFQSKSLASICLKSRAAKDNSKCTELPPWELLPVEHWWKPSCLHAVWPCQLLFQPYNWTVSI